MPPPHAYVECHIEQGPILRHKNLDVGVVTGVLPTKGMSLPFISAGLSNLLLMGLLVGILINTQRTWARASLPQGAGAMREVLA